MSLTLKFLRYAFNTTYPGIFLHSWHEKAPARWFLPDSAYYMHNIVRIMRIIC